MALINGYYIFVKDEDMSRGVEVTSHPVETGIDVTDNVRRKPITISLSGQIVQVGNTKAKEIKTAIAELHKGGKLIKYQGRESLSNAIITSFDTGTSNEVAGGYTFEMEIQEIRIAKSAYKASSKTSTTTKQVTTKKPADTKRYYTVKSGDCLWNIAVKYYGDGTKYTKIYNANKDKIKSNYIIYVGQKLVIP